MRQTITKKWLYRLCANRQWRQEQHGTLTLTFSSKREREKEKEREKGTVLDRLGTSKCEMM